jgi:tyrosinase
MSPRVRVQPRERLSTPKVRQSVRNMSAGQVGRFRAAVEKLVARNDNRGFQFFAGWHGVPLDICQHHDEFFLPWHRGYLWHFELALQDIDPDVTLPWWNWMDEPGIPNAFARKKVDGKPNILASAPIKPLGIPRQPGWPTRTRRAPAPAVPPPGQPGPLGPPLAEVVFPATPRGAWDWIMAANTYNEFNQRCWRIHDNIHVWVGGEMMSQAWAAFDPLFWVHHSMVDRLWRVWQHDHPGALPNQQTLETGMVFAKGPPLKVKDLLDTKQLGYEYAGQSSSVGGPG